MIPVGARHMCHAIVCCVPIKRMKVEIKRATPDQAEILTQIAFAAKSYWGYPERWLQLWMPILTVSPEFIEKRNTYVAYEDGKPVGFCAISLEDKKADLEHLWVLPDFIGQGIGTRLFNHVLSGCKAAGAHVLEIESDPNAQGFYERMGARKIGEAIGKVNGQLRVLPVLELTLF